MRIVVVERDASRRGKLAGLIVGLSIDGDGEDIVGVLTSYPPGDSATEAEVGVLRAAIAERMEKQGGRFSITKRQGLVRGRKA